MLTVESLAERLKLFQQGTLNLTLIPSPILLYQNLFGLVHELKSSAVLSHDRLIIAQIKNIESCNELLRRLANDQAELQPSDSQKLLEIALNLNSLLALEEFLNVALKKQITTTSVNFSLWPQYSWESLSEARATSCLRHGCWFFEKSFEMDLQQLEGFVVNLQESLGKAGGLAIHRQLKPLAQNSNSSMRLNVFQLIALAENKVPDFDLPWARLR